MTKQAEAKSETERQWRCLADALTYSLGQSDLPVEYAQVQGIAEDTVDWLEEHGYGLGSALSGELKHLELDPGQWLVIELPPKTHAETAQELIDMLPEGLKERVLIVAGKVFVLDGERGF